MKRPIALRPTGSMKLGGRIAGAHHPDTDRSFKSARVFS